MKVAFCVAGITERVLQRTEFYWQDYEILRSLGHEVTFISSPFSLRGSYQLAFVWWWNYLWEWGPIASFRGVPILTTGVFDIGSFHEMPWFKRKLKLWGARKSDLNVVLSRQEERELPGMLGEGHGPVRFSPLAVDSRVYAAPSKKASDENTFTILNIAWQRATNIRRKMVPELLEAFAILTKESPGCRLVLAGPSEDGGPVLQARARELGVESRVEFPGEVSREKKVELLQKCSLYSQVSRYEGFGLAIAEAMACGAPVLVSSAGAVPEVVGDCGTYVKEPSVQGILEGLRHCMNQPDELRQKADKAVERVRTEFSVERRREDLRRFIGELV
jgi:glycosyltransferase involved in cell wall biosynthesis